MNTIKYLPSNPEKNFIVSKNDINNSNALLPNKLYNTMEEFAASIIKENKEISNSSPRLYKLEMLKNAFLDDKLLLQSKIIKYNSSELQLSIQVKRKDKKTLNTVCKAIFKFKYKSLIPKAS